MGESKKFAKLKSSLKINVAIMVWKKRNDLKADRQ